MSDSMVASEEMLGRKIKLLIEFRGYVVEDKIDGKNLTDYIIRDGKGKKILLRVIYSTPLISGKVGVHFVRKLKENMEKEGFDRGILVGQGFSYSARKESRAKGIEAIQEEKIPAFNIFEHHLVPEHEILSKEEAKELLKEYHVEAYQLPQIRTSDPAVFLIGARPGDIVKITRKSPTAGVHVTYRHVV
jgi:DNA-directed RNA polymerase subunit H